jgi:hypothetical protein
MESNLHLKTEAKDESQPRDSVVDDPMNGWTDRKVSQLKKKMDQLKILRYLHKKVAGHYSKLNDILSLPNITIEAIISASLFVSLSEKVNENARFWINMTLGFIALIGTILGIWVKYFKAGDKMHGHADASRVYSDIYDDIDDQLSMEIHERTNGKEFLTYIKKMINQQNQNQLDIDQTYWDDYFESVSKGELINLNYTLINQDNDNDKGTHEVIEIEPTMILEEDNQSGVDVITNNSESLASPSNVTPKPVPLVPLVQLMNKHREDEDNKYIENDIVKFHFNKMSDANLKKNLQFQLSRFAKP